MSDDVMFVFPENELKAPQDLLLSQTGDLEAKVQLLNLCKFYYEEIYLKLNQIVDLAYPLCNIGENHLNELAESMCP